MARRTTGFGEVGSRLVASMKLILRDTTAGEAHLVAEALRQEGIAASVQHERGIDSRPSVWIENDADWERASRAIDDMRVRSDATPAPVQPTSHRGIFVAGLLIGTALGIVIIGIIRGSVVDPRAENYTWDNNSDGVDDEWARYDAADRIVESSRDRNFDGKGDSWLTYAPPGILNKSRDDSNFDGLVDYWGSYEKGLLVSYTADNDRNGAVDEWGRVENDIIVERNWSFLNDQIADKRAFYRAGLKVREEYDRNRDGVFDETILFDAFERVISR
jgi:hypothetical protein